MKMIIWIKYIEMIKPEQYHCSAEDIVEIIDQLDTTTIKQVEYYPATKHNTMLINNNDLRAKALRELGEKTVIKRSYEKECKSFFFEFEA